MKNKSGKSKVFVLVLLSIIAILLVYSFGSGALRNGMADVGNFFAGNSNNNNNQVSDNSCGQNPSISVSFVNALTSQPITASVLQYKDSATGRLLGTSPSFTKGQKVIPIVNASGYLTEVQPEYTVICGAQSLQGDLYQFANETIQIYNNAGTGVIGGVASGVGNDTAFTTQVNHKIIMTGNTFKSDGKKLIVLEISNTSSMSSATLTMTGSQNPLTSITVPNCHSNTLTGTPYRIAWEVPAIIGGNQVQYNLQELSSNGKTVSGETVLTVYNEKDGYDTLNGNVLTTGICDSNNAFYNMDKVVNVWNYN